MATTKSLSFGERMLRKMGHQDGKGLGKDLSGIINPVEAHTATGQFGLGYTFADDGWGIGTQTERSSHWEDLESLSLTAHDDTWVQQPTDSPTDDMEWGPTRSNIVQIIGLPRRAEPSYVYRLFDASEQDTIKEIVCTEGNKDGTAYVTFVSEDKADAAMDKYSGKIWGPDRRKITLVPVTEEYIPTGSEKSPILRLTDFLGHSGNNTVRSSTVLITRLPEKKTLSSLNALLRKDGLDENDIVNKHAIPEEPGSARVQFVDEATSDAFVRAWNGNYWKDNTLTVKCVEDQESKDQPKMSPTVNVYVSNLEPGSTEADVRELFEPTELLDVAIPSKKNGNKKGLFCFVLIDEANAVDALKVFPKIYKGRKINANISKDQNNKEILEDEIRKAKRRTQHQEPITAVGTEELSRKETQQRNHPETEPVASTLPSTPLNQGGCAHCGKTGHRQDSCFALYPEKRRSFMRPRNRGTRGRARQNCQRENER
jgi:RNA recognition motif-containing protein